MPSSSFDVLVESNITGVSVDLTKSAVMVSGECRDGKRWLLTAYQATGLYVSEMRLQNIVDRMNIWDSSNDEFECAKRIYFLTFGRFPVSLDETENAVVKKALDSIKAQKSILIEIEAVFGALVFIHAKNFTLSNEEKGTESDGSIY